MYLTQDMEPTEQTAASKQPEMLDKLLLNKFETEEELTAPDEVFDEIDNKKT